MISPLATRLDVINNARYSKAGIVSQLSAVPMTFRADLRVSHAKKFGVTQISARERSRAALFASTSTTDEKRISAACAAIESLISRAKTPYFRLISDQSFRHSWSLAGCRLEFLAARIVVRNKEVLNLGD